jgi:hypothetical protein
VVGDTVTGGTEDGAGSFSSTNVIYTVLLSVKVFCI